MSSKQKRQAPKRIRELLEEADFPRLYLERLIQARYIKTQNGRPLLTPQDVEIGAFFLSHYLSGMEQYMVITLDKVEDCSKLFASVVNGMKEDSADLFKGPEKAKMQGALKKLDKLGLIKYRAIRKLEDGKAVRQIEIKIGHNIPDSPIEG